MTAKQAELSDEETHRSFFRDVLQNVRRIMAEKYGLDDVSIRPIGSGASRLSIPVKITGVNERGKKVTYFGKILGSSDIMTARSIQFFKNIYLQMNEKDPIFGVSKSAEEMAREQYETLKAIHKIGVPTAKPFGYHWINGILWLVVVEYLEAKTRSAGEEHEDADWAGLSLSGAMRGMEEEPSPYTTADIKEAFS
jgi:hypothetical protein